MNYINCDGILRRDFLRVGALAGLGLGLPDFLARASAGAVNGQAKAKAAIFVRLGGGPSHMDTFDLKPDAPATHRGEFKDIPTSVPGIRICEHLPKLAKCADKYVILRGVSHNLAAHELGLQYLGTGNRPGPALRYPSFGSVVAKEFAAAPELPAFVAIPNEGPEAAGYLGVEYGPFETGATPQAGRPMDIRGLSLKEGVTLTDVDRRQDMMGRYDRAFGTFGQKDKLLAGMDQFNQRAYAMMRSPRTREAFDLAKESAAITGMFGAEPFSQSCLLAVRLIEAGARFVTVNQNGWDTHVNNFNTLKNTLLPAHDSGLSGLFLALHAKGLLDSTTVFVTGEFGRTPAINARGGRDHWPRAMCCLMAGGGISGGRVIGASDAKGEGPKDTPITPEDIAASFYHSLGIDSQKEYQTPSGRPVRIVREGKPLKEIFG
jgi:uncharacterized protein (DUF1501 family)